jgi:SAM-dependent methyltransferase
MGIEIHGLRFIAQAQKTHGVDLSSCATIGRQHLDVAPSVVEKIVGRPFAGYADDLLRHMGATTLDTYDHSDYEQATHIHDMNLPLPDHLKGRYSLVIDGGSLEHVFNFPQALKNCMEMVKPGGHFMALTITNNFSGHGFYQFSPELFYNALTPDNGYSVQSMLACEDSAFARVYAVRSPDEVKDRVTLINGRPTYLMVLAKRILEVEPFKAAPQQSFYVNAWDSKKAPAEPRVPSRLRTAARRLLDGGFKKRFFAALG